MYKHIIFDFDGTIVDSKSVMNDAINQIAVERKHKKVDINDYKSLSILEKLRLLLIAKKIKPEFLRLYGEKIGSIKAYDKMIELMTSLQEHGYILAIITANDEAIVRKFFRINKIAVKMEVHSSDGFRGKHKAIRMYMNQNGCGSADVLYIGDEIRDIRECARIGVDIAYVRWGLDGSVNKKKPVPKYSVSTPDELFELLIASRNQYK